MVSNALGFLLETVFGLFIYAFLLRFLFQRLRVPLGNPLGHFLFALTDFAVKPMRRILPGWKGVDWSTLLLAWLAEFLLTIAMAWVSGFPFALAGGGGWLTLFLLSGVNLLRTFIQMYIFIILAQALLSWVQPYSPIAAMLDVLTRPVLKPLRGLIPPIGGVDLTPLVAIVLAQLLLMLPVAWLDMFVRTL